MAGTWEDDRWDRGARIAIGAGAALRLVWVMVLHPPYLYVFSDMHGYLSRAGKVAAGASPDRLDAFYPPGTHLILAIPLKLTSSTVTGLLADALLWWALSSAVPLVAWLFFRRLLGPKPAALATLLCATWPLLIAYAGYFTSETPSLALLLTSLWLARRALVTEGGQALLAATGAGAAAASAIGTRPQFLLNVAIAGFPLLWSWRDRRWVTASFVASSAAVLAGVVTYNSVAAGRLTGVSENGGMTFFQAQCEAHSVAAGNLAFANPVAAERGRGRDYVFAGHQPWDQGFFYREGLGCMRRNGWRHLAVAGRNLLGATATSTPWPLFSSSRLKAVSRTVNLAYCLALPVLVLGALSRLRAGGERNRALRGGIRDLLLHLAAAIPIVVVFSSEPRYRIPYDVFGLALLATLVVARGRRHDPEEPAPPSSTPACAATAVAPTPCASSEG